ncbi:alpha/beta fold hydrolase [Streptomyces sporangiiformans]|uniref:Alpha/beta fold hydrolase n=1 Tax=Streptomyces sporangiiformans TaxID=2315329 RepID=A0A505D8E3_9ACTN|nr:alpha/beta fold hydrolase [Streptomyces sporangiiformans]TPQ18045.1 alpha/beta fold hydrolase [Streptomyces sporangiiformans]
MAWLSEVLSIAGQGGDRALRVAVGLRGLLLGALWLRREPAAGPDGERGQVVVPPRAAWFVQGQAADLSPVTVAYERQGSGDPVVLLHGLGCHRQAWDPVVPLLTGQREVIAMDLPGFGQSPDLDPGVPRDLQTAVAWLGSVFAALGVERPHVVGHSLGGLITLRLGQAGLARSVTALAPAGFWTSAERRYAYAVLTGARQGVRLLPEAALARLVGTAPARAVLTGTLYGRSDLCPPERVVAALRPLRDSAAFQATLRAGRAPDLFAGDIPDVPVTIAWGTRDRLLPPRQAVRARAMIPNARLVALTDCGHVPMLDAPELVARTILHATEPGRQEWEGQAGIVPTDEL